MKLWLSSGSWCRTTSVAGAFWFPQEFLHSQCTLEGSEVVPETPLCFSTSKKHHAPQNKMQWWFSTCMPNTLVCKCGVVFGWCYTLGERQLFLFAICEAISESKVKGPSLESQSASEKYGILVICKKNHVKAWLFIFVHILLKWIT